jgi:hypothetical protein
MIDLLLKQRYCEQSNKSVSTLFKKIIKNGYKIGKPNEK